MIAIRRRLARVAVALALSGCVAATGCKKDDEPTYGDQVAQAYRRGKASGARGDLQVIAAGVTSYMTNEDGLPEAGSIEELAALLEPKYVRRLPRNDPWGKPYGFTSTSSSYTVTCAGHDGVFGTGDDLVLEDGQITKMPEGYTRFEGE